MTIRFRILDWVILASSILITAAFTWFFFVQGSGPARLEINTATNQYIYLLAQDQVLHFSGPAGDTEVHIKNGEAWVAASACTNKLCIAMGHVSHNGDWVACLPNRIFLRVAAGSDQGIDAKTF